MKLGDGLFLRFWLAPLWFLATLIPINLFFLLCVNLILVYTHNCVVSSFPKVLSGRSCSLPKHWVWSGLEKWHDNHDSQVCHLYSKSYMSVGQSISLQVENSPTTCLSLFETEHWYQVLQMIVDNTTMQLVSKPQQFDVMVGCLQKHHVFLLDFSDKALQSKVEMSFVKVRPLICSRWCQTCTETSSTTWLSVSLVGPALLVELLTQQVLLHWQTQVSRLNSFFSSQTHFAHKDLKV